MDLGELVVPYTQADLKGLLDADPQFVDVPTIIEDEGDLLYQVLISTGAISPKTGQTKFGVCAVIAQPSGRDRDSGVQFGPFDLEWQIWILENRLLNKDTANGGTGKAAFSLARRAARLWKNYRSGGLIINFSGLRIVPQNLVLLGEDKSETSFIGYAVKANGAEGDATVYQKCAPVIISPNSGAVPQTVSLTCATPGASIYWTQDATLSHPFSGNAAAALYAAPLAITAAGTLRARAHKTDYIGSDVTAAHFT